jgi:ankyrin repeat protein
VTPLWCASVAGRFSVVKVLIRHGANVDAASDSGSTSTRSACYIVRPGLQTAHMEIVKCLVKAGADLSKSNHFGGTCLINSVQSPSLIKLLLDTKR